MAITTRSSWSSTLLVDYITRLVTNLEPKLHFLRLGTEASVPNGYNQFAVPKVNQFDNETDVSTITEGVNPTAVTWGSSAYMASPTQKGLVVQLSDLLVRNSAVETMRNASIEVRNVVARAIDSNIQATVSAGTQVLRAGGKASRAALASGDVLTPDIMTKGVTKLDAASVERISNAFIGVIHPNISGDIMNNTSAGVFMGFYTRVEDVREHKLGLFRGAAYLPSGNVDTFASSITVYPTLLLGEDSYRYGWFQRPTPILVTQADSNNPLNVYQSVGMKATIAVTRLQEEKLVRLESATNQV